MRTSYRKSLNGNNFFLWKTVYIFSDENGLARKNVLISNSAIPVNSYDRAKHIASTLIFVHVQNEKILLK